MARLQTAPTVRSGYASVHTLFLFVGTGNNGDDKLGDGIPGRITCRQRDGGIPGGNAGNVYDMSIAGETDKGNTGLGGADTIT